ncbi:MAG: HIT domain-containing protein, partial [Patescibacteria group bacterium]
MNDTIFGKIIRKEVPAAVVYENQEFLCFMDINPAAKGHVLLIPKEQYD